MRTALLAVLSTTLLAAAARAGDDAPPPLAEIVAAVKAREAATFPRGLTYDVAGRNAGTKTAWFARGEIVLRRTLRTRGAEVVDAWDGVSHVFGTRVAPDGAWSGRRSDGSGTSFDAACLWFEPSGKFLSEELGEAKSEVLGWSDVDGVRCVAVLVHPYGDQVYELDPARGFAPLRIRLVLGEHTDDDICAAHPEEEIAGRKFRPVAWFTATELRYLGAGAWVPSRVEQVFRIGDEDRETSTLTATDHVEDVRPGVVEASSTARASSRSRARTRCSASTATSSGRRPTACSASSSALGRRRRG